MTDARTPTQDHLARGHQARLAGRSQEALAHFAAAAAQSPDDPEANSVYGLMLLRMRRIDEAEAPLRKAVTLAPEHPALLVNLAEWLAASGRTEEAMTVLRRTVDLDPRFYWGWDRLGDLGATLRNFTDALHYFSQAAALRPGDPGALCKLARANIDLDRIEDAERILADAARIAPQFDPVVRVQAALFERKADWANLERLAQAWMDAGHNRDEALLMLVKAQWESRRPRQAVESYANAIASEPPDARNFAALGTMCIRAQDYRRADEALLRAEALDPNNSEMLRNKTTILMYRGEYDRAMSYCRRALEVRPDDGAAFRLLTQLMSSRLPDDQLSALRTLAQRSDLQPRWNLASANFALADCLDERREFAEAFAVYVHANTIARETAAAGGSRYDHESRRREVDRLIETFKAPKPAACSAAKPRPIFVVGMPRSGTTLIESVIGAHSTVVAGGELLAMRGILAEVMADARNTPIRDIPDESWRRWGERYRFDVAQLLGPADVITDKNPWNFEAVGVISRLFPDARIVHVRRNPLETGLSIYRNEFGNGIPYATSLEDIGRYYGEYARLVAHWENNWPGRIITIQYEDFVENFDVACPALVDACGLAWEDGCRDFTKSPRLISTLSTMQARKPPRLTQGRAASYAEYLTPLEEALRAAGVDLKTGALKNE